MWCGHAWRAHSGRPAIGGARSFARFAHWMRMGSPDVLVRYGEAFDACQCRVQVILCGAARRGGAFPCRLGVTVPLGQYSAVALSHGMTPDVLSISPPTVIDWQ
eukprot:6176009-Prymnesium_polylepis.1